MSRSVSAPSLVTKTSPCWNGFIVPGIHVEVGVQLLHRHAQSAGLQQAAQAGGGQPLAEGGGDASGDEYVLGRRRVLHGLLPTPGGRLRPIPTHRRTHPDVGSERARARTAVTWPTPVSTPSTVATSSTTGLAARRLRARRGRRTRCPPRRRRRPPGRPGPVTRPARIASELVTGVRPSTTSTSGERCATRRLGHQAGAADGVDDGTGRAVDVLARGLLGRDRDAEQLSDPVVRRRLGGDVALGLLGQQLAAQRVDQRLLGRGRRCPRTGRSVPRPCRRRRSPASPSAVTTCSSAPGTVTTATEPVREASADRGRPQRANDALGEVGLRPVRRGARVRLPGRGRGGGADVGERAAAEDDPRREGEEDGDDGERGGGGG